MFDVLNTTEGELHAATGHVIGCTYWCGYWQQVYTVLAIGRLDGTRCDGVVCLWDDDEVNCHCTPLGRGDQELQGVLS